MRRIKIVFPPNGMFGTRVFVDGVEVVEWLANTDGKSGDRHHEQMSGNQITVAAMNGNDPGEWFLTPLGNRMPYPRWGGAPAKEIANCRCNLAAA